MFAHKLLEVVTNNYTAFMLFHFAVICFYMSGFLGMFFALLGVLGKDREAIMKDGFFQGYSYIVWTAIALQVS